MAFNTNPAAAPQAVPAFEKASGFINIYLPSKDGKRRKVGAIALRASKANEKQMLDFLDEDEGNIAKLAAKLIVEYQSAVVTEAHSLDL